MQVRAWKPSDGPQIVALVTAILNQEFPSERSAYPSEDLQHLESSYQGPESAFLVAEASGRVVGTCGVKAEDAKRAILRRLFVSPEHRGQGVGRALLEQALVFCRERGFREVIIRTSSRMEQAIQLCRALGFREDGQWNLGAVTLRRLRLRLT